MSLTETTLLEDLTELEDHIKGQLGENVISTQVAYGELTVTVPCSQIIPTLKFLKTDALCLFNQLMDIGGVDYPERRKRFDVVYHFLSMYQNHRIRLKMSVREEDAVPSLTGVFPSANWFEREVFDMFGLLFSGHPDLRRILTDYGFHGFPLRKDFPLTGFTQVVYDEEQKRVVYEPVNLVQEYREFDFLSPWEGAKYVLPGDEKAEGKDA